MLIKTMSRKMWTIWSSLSISIVFCLTIIDVTDVSKMMEKLGQPKNILQIKKIIAEIDLDGTGTVSYREFLRMMLGNKSSIMKM